MEIPALNQLSSLDGIQNIGRNPELREKLISLREQFSGDSFQMSEMGARMNEMRQFVMTLDEDQQAEMHQFRQDMHSAVESGTFDAAQMAEDAPEFLKSYAQEKGLDLDEMFSQFATDIEDKMQAMDELKAFAQESGIDLESMISRGQHPGGPKGAGPKGSGPMMGYSMGGEKIIPPEEDPIQMLMDALLNAEEAETGSTATGE